MKPLRDPSYSPVTSRGRRALVLGSSPGFRLSGFVSAQVQDCGWGGPSRSISSDQNRSGDHSCYGEQLARETTLLAETVFK